MCLLSTHLSLSNLTLGQLSKSPLPEFPSWALPRWVCVCILPAWLASWDSPHPYPHCFPLSSFLNSMSSPLWLPPHFGRISLPGTSWERWHEGNITFGKRACRVRRDLATEQQQQHPWFKGSFAGYRILGQKLFSLNVWRHCSIVF